MLCASSGKPVTLSLSSTEKQKLALSWCHFRKLAFIEPCLFLLGNIVLVLGPRLTAVETQGERVNLRTGSEEMQQAPPTHLSRILQG